MIEKIQKEIEFIKSNLKFYKNYLSHDISIGNLEKSCVKEQIKILKRYQEVLEERLKYFTSF